ncbi:MAG: hypothetical protein NZ578_01715 [Candidatus Binatia bacterium]|nr:hypothetical protein [Candidatus Binatia bacterium]
MPTLCYLIVLWLLGISAFASSSCSWLFPPKKVECCEKVAPCCYEQMCCLPRYTRAAGKEPKPFTPEAPVYGTAQELDPKPGETITKPGLLSRLNPFGRSEDEQPSQAESTADAEEEKDDKGFLERLLPF